MAKVKFDKESEKALKELGASVKDLDITLSYGNSNLHRKIAEALQEGWTRTFNIQIKMEQLEDKVMFDHLNKHNFSIIARFNIRN